MSDHIILLGKPSAQTLEPMGLKLQDLGFNLHVVTTTAQALALVRNAKPAAILIDVCLPELGGIEMVKTIKPLVNGTPIIALNDNQTRLRKAALAAGVDMVVDYPVNWGDLKSWLAGPRGVSGRPLSVGTLLGRTKEEVLGSSALLSHDLKSPISLVISSLEVLMNLYEDDQAPDSTLRLLKGALHAAYRQMNMITELIDLARLELANYELQLDEIDLSQSVRDRLQIDAYALAIKGLRIETILPGEPVLLHADSDLIGRAISAMFENTIKFTVRDDLLRITVGCEGRNAVLSFTDSGRMIQEGFESEIMVRAPQWEKRQAGNRTSVGMSLPFVHAVAEAHGGTFSAVSDPETRLTTFKFTLPIY